MYETIIVIQCISIAFVFAEGFSDYLSKPVDGEKLEKLLMAHLPPAKVRTPQPDAAPSPELSDAATALIADDDPADLPPCGGHPRKRFRVETCRSGAETPLRAEQLRPDLILLDYDMRVTPGPQVLEMIRSEPNSAKIPVIFLTGKNGCESVLSVMRLKPEGYLLKSMSKADILASVDRFFETRKWENLYQ